MDFLVALFLTSLLLLTLAVEARAVVLDERPAVPGEWGFRPFDGSRPDQTPPGFSWRPCEGASGYVLQIAKTDSFKKMIYERENLIWSSHCPSEILKPGRYYWRYRAKGLGEDGAETTSEWSQIRSFVIGKDAVPFPQPSIEDLEAKIPKGHLRLFFRAEDLSTLKAHAKGELKTSWGALIEAAEKNLLVVPDVSEPPLYPPGISFKSNEWKDIWWGNHDRTVRLLEPASMQAFMYALSGDERYGQAARERLKAFCKWDPQGASNFSYNDEAAMPALYYAARAATWAWPVLTDEERTTLTAVMRERGRQCFEVLTRQKHLWTPYSSHSNRSWHFLGETALAFYWEIPEAKTWLDFSMTVLYTAYPVWCDSYGGWHEGTAYWNSYMSLFLVWAETLRSAFGIDVYERPFYHHAGDYGMYLAPPGTVNGGFGDRTESANAKAIAPLMRDLGVGAQNPYWLWHAESCGVNKYGGYIGFLRAARSLGLKPRPPADLPSSKNFPGVGLAVMNTNLVDGKDNVQIQFKSSPFGRQSHGFNSNNAFLLNVNGEGVFIQSGRREVYGGVHHKGWMWETKSDNAILVNGVGQIPHTRDAVGEITQWSTSDTVDVVAGEAGASYDKSVLSRWTRRIVFFKPSIIVIHDILEAPNPSTFQWLLHAPSEFKIGNNQVDWERNPGRVRVSFLEPQGLSIHQTDKFDPGPKDWPGWDLVQWHLSADTSTPVKRQEFLTLIAVNADDVTYKTKKKTDALVIEITASGKTGSLTLRDKSFTVKWEAFKRVFRDKG